MEFNFGAKGKPGGKPKTDGATLKQRLEEITDDIDITEGISEADCRLALNKLGRATSMFLLANGIAGAHASISTPYDEVYKFLCRRGLGYCDAVAGEDSPQHTRKLLPFNIS